MRAKAGVETTARVRRTLRPCAFGGPRQRVHAHAWALGVLVGSLCSMALALSCAGPLSDACDELGTCRPAEAGLVDAREAGLRPVDAAPDHVADVSVEPFVCDGTKDPIDEPCVLDDVYGVFVASQAGLEAGSDAGEVDVDSGDMDGSKARPCPTIGQALANLGSKASVYVCNGAYSEQVNISTPVHLYGGLSCPAGANGRIWSYVGETAQVMSPSSGYALSIAGVSSMPVTIEDVSFTSPDATAAATSSIAALVASSSVNLLRVVLRAGNGANGQAGADGTAAPNYSGAAAAGGPQMWSGPGVTPISGGAGGVNACLQHGSSMGGDGGLGCSRFSGSRGLGTPGTANPAAPATVAGRDGLAADTDVPMDGGIVPTNDPGADGLPVAGGMAGSAQSYGTLSPTGWVPTAGGDGASGNPGQGGAGATDPLYGACGTSTDDIGGGGGGAGGCGGAGGQGGGGGGASIALAAIDSTIDLKDCNLVAAAGGTGGPGGAGQDGQAGGAGGDDTSFGSAHAPGAAGGNGAGGSGGAGGTGGISVGVLYMHSTIMSDSATTESTTLGPSGAGGASGPAGLHPTAGALTTGADGKAGRSGQRRGVHRIL